MERPKVKNHVNERIRRGWILGEKLPMSNRHRWDVVHARGT